MDKRLILIALSGLLAGPATALAQANTSEWLCESCPFEDGYRADYEAGATYVSDDAARFGNATGYDEEGTYVNLDGEGHYASDKMQLDWYAEDLGLDSRVAELSLGNQGSYGLYLGYRELPYRLFDTTQTVFNASTPDTLTLPSDWVSAGTTSGMTALDSSLVKRNIQSDRQTIDAGGHWLAGRRWRLFADYQRQNREGVDIMGGAGFTNSSLLPRVFNYETDRIDIGVQYAMPKGAVSLAYYGSFFSNKNTALTWDTPFTSTAGADQPRMAQEPDNDFQQVSLTGHYRFNAWDQVFALSLAGGRGEQNHALVPYTSNPNLVSPLPRATAEGKVDTMNYAFTWTARPMDILRLKAAYRYDDRDNATTQTEWTRVIVDLVDSGEAEQNIPYSFKRARLNLSAEIRLWDQVRFAAGYDRTELDRDYQEVAEQTEDTGWGQLRWQPSSWFDLRARAGTSKRDIDRYDETVSASLGQNPLLRKYNLAYRFRKFGELTASASMSGAPVSFSVTALTADDSYSQSKLGMTESEELRVTADITWAITDHASAYIMAGSERMNADQFGSEAFADADWQAAHDDRFKHIGAGLVWQQVTQNLDLQLDYTRGDGTTGIYVASESGGEDPLPDLTSTLDSLRLEGVYRWSDRWEATLDVRYEKFSSDDWALKDVTPDAVPNLLSLGAEPINYDVWAVGLGFRYRFGNRELELAN